MKIFFMSSTIKCVVCGSKATCFGGHVHNGDDKVIAGFCKEHFRNTAKENNDCKGCYGEYKEEMGVDITFGQVCYIDSK